MLRPVLTALILALGMIPAMVGCGDQTARPETACRNLVDLPARERTDAVANVAVERCGLGIRPMCRAMTTYVDEVVIPAMDPVTALGPDDEGETMAVLAASFREAEERVGPDRVHRLNRDAVDAATEMGGSRGQAIARMMEWMPGGSDVVTATSSDDRLIAIRIVLEQVVDLCTPPP